MNSAGRAAIRTALSNVEDDLYRFKHFMSDGTTTPYGDTKEDIVTRLEKERDELRAALVEVEA